MRAEDFNDAYDDSVKKIWSDFDQWLPNGSRWVLERVEILYLNSARYDPIYWRSFIKTLKGIAVKKAVVNVQNKDNQCFKWAILSALYSLLIFFLLKGMRNLIIHGSRTSIGYYLMVLIIPNSIARIAAMGLLKKEMEKKISGNTSLIV